MTSATSSGVNGSQPLWWWTLSLALGCSEERIKKQSERIAYLYTFAALSWSPNRTSENSCQGQLVRAYREDGVYVYCFNLPRVNHYHPDLCRNELLSESFRETPNCSFARTIDPARWVWLASCTSGKCRLEEMEEVCQGKLDINFDNLPAMEPILIMSPCPPSGRAWNNGRTAWVILMRPMTLVSSITAISSSAMSGALDTPFARPLNLRKFVLLLR